MDDILNQIPGYKNNSHIIYAEDQESAMYICAQMASDLLNKWNTNVAFFSLSCRSEALKALVKNESAVARLYTVDQKNPDFRVIRDKAFGMYNRRFVRAIIIEGKPKWNDGRVWEPTSFEWPNTTAVYVQVKEDSTSEP